jgi:RHS repeat-associated protein
MTTDYYYNTDWKCVEERDSGETCPRKQYAYGIRGRNDIIERDNYLYNSSSGSPSCSSAGKERHYALNDAMGSVTAVASTAGTVVERYSYTAFGQSQVMTANFADRSMSLYDWQTRFHGESRDEETGYYNYGYRYYDPKTGRWPSRDPMGESGGLNVYNFVKNNGINWIDLLGLKGKKADPDKCCDQETIDKSEKELRKRYKEAYDAFQKRGIKPEGKGKRSCKNISGAVIGVLAPIPKCWECKEERRSQWIFGIGPDHQYVVCKSNPQDGSKPKEIAFDYWKGNKDGVDPKDLRNEYPNSEKPDQPFHVIHNNCNKEFSRIRPLDPIDDIPPTPVPKIEPQLPFPLVVPNANRGNGA